MRSDDPPPADAARATIPLKVVIPAAFGVGSVLVLMGMAWGATQAKLDGLSEHGKSMAIHLSDIDRHLGQIDVSLARISGLPTKTGFPGGGLP